MTEEEKKELGTQSVVKAVQPIQSINLSDLITPAAPVTDIGNVEQEQQVSPEQIEQPIPEVQVAQEEAVESINVSDLISTGQPVQEPVEQSRGQRNPEMGMRNQIEEVESIDFSELETPLNVEKEMEKTEAMNPVRSPFKYANPDQTSLPEITEFDSSTFNINTDKTPIFGEKDPAYEGTGYWNSAEEVWLKNGQSPFVVPNSDVNSFAGKQYTEEQREWLLNNNVKGFADYDKFKRGEYIDITKITSEAKETIEAELREEVPNFDNFKTRIPETLKNVDALTQSLSLELEDFTNSIENDKIKVKNEDDEEVEINKFFYEVYEKYKDYDLTDELLEREVVSTVNDMRYEKFVKTGAVESLEGISSRELKDLLSSSSFLNASPDDKKLMMLQFHKGVDDFANVPAGVFLSNNSRFITPKLDAILLKGVGSDRMKQLDILEEDFENLSGMDKTVNMREFVSTGKPDASTKKWINLSAKYLGFDKRKFLELVEKGETDKAYKMVADNNNEKAWAETGLGKARSALEGIMDLDYEKTGNFSNNVGTILEGLSKNKSKLAPFYGGAKGLFENMAVNRAGKNITNKEGSTVDDFIMESVSAFSTYRSLVDENFAHSLGTEIFPNMVSFIGEMATTGGIGTIAQQGTKKVLLTTLKRYGVKNASTWSPKAVSGFAKFVDLNVRTSTSGVFNIPKGAIERMTPESSYFFSVDGNKIINEIDNTTGGNFAESMLKGYLTQLTEVGTERMGDFLSNRSIFTKLTSSASRLTKAEIKYLSKAMNFSEETVSKLKSIYSNLSASGYAARLMLDKASKKTFGEVNPFNPSTYTPKAVREFLKSGSINNVGYEIFEEFVAARIQPPIDGDYSKIIPSWDELKHETFQTAIAMSPLMAFGISGGIISSVATSRKKTADGTYDYQDLAKEVVSASSVEFQNNLEKLQSRSVEIENKNLSENAIMLIEKRLQHESSGSPLSFEKFFEEYKKQNSEYLSFKNDVDKVIDSDGLDFIGEVNRRIDESIDEDIAENYRFIKSNYLYFKESGSTTTFKKYLGDEIGKFESVRDKLLSFLDKGSFVGNFEKIRSEINEMKLPPKKKEALSNLMDRAESVFESEKSKFFLEPAKSPEEQSSFVFGKTQVNKSNDESFVFENPEDASVLENVIEAVKSFNVENSILAKNIINNSNLDVESKNKALYEVAKRLNSSFEAYDSIDEAGASNIIMLANEINSIFEMTSMPNHIKSDFNNALKDIIKKTIETGTTPEKASVLRKMIYSVSANDNLVSMKDMNEMITALRITESNSGIEEPESLSVSVSVEKKLSDKIRKFRAKTSPKWSEIVKENKSAKALNDKLNEMVADKTVNFSIKAKNLLTSAIAFIDKDLIDFKVAIDNKATNSVYNPNNNTITIATGGKKIAATEAQLVSEIAEEVVHSVHMKFAGDIASARMDAKSIEAVTGKKAADVIVAITKVYDSFGNKTKPSKSNRVIFDSMAVNGMIDTGSKKISYQDFLANFARYEMFLGLKYNKEQAIYYASSFEEFFARMFADHLLGKASAYGNLSGVSEILDSMKDWVIKNVAMPFFAKFANSSSVESLNEFVHKERIKSDVFSKVLSQEQINDLELAYNEIGTDKDNKKISFTVNENGEIETKFNSKRSSFGAKRSMTTPKFDSWFSGSIYKNKDGNPEVFKHVTNEIFTEFDKNKIGSNTERENNKGFFFLKDSEETTDLLDEFAMHPETNLDNPKIISVNLSLKKPLNLNNIFSDDKQAADIVNVLGIDEWTDATEGNAMNILDGATSTPNDLSEIEDMIFEMIEDFQKLGYDHVVSSFGKDDSNNTILEYMVFDSNRIKDVSNKNPTLESNDMFGAKRSEHEVDKNLFGNNNESSGNFDYKEVAKVSEKIYGTNDVALDAMSVEPTKAIIEFQEIAKLHSTKDATFGQLIANVERLVKKFPNETSQLRQAFKDELNLDIQYDVSKKVSDIYLGEKEIEQVFSNPNYKEWNKSSKLPKNMSILTHGSRSVEKIYAGEQFGVDGRIANAEKELQRYGKEVSIARKKLAKTLKEQGERNTLVILAEGTLEQALGSVTFFNQEINIFKERKEIIEKQISRDDIPTDIMTFMSDATTSSTYGKDNGVFAVRSDNPLLIDFGKLKNQNWSAIAFSFKEMNPVDLEGATAEELKKREIEIGTDRIAKKAILLGYDFISMDKVRDLGPLYSNLTRKEMSSTSNVIVVDNTKSNIKSVFSEEFSPTRNLFNAKRNQQEIAKNNLHKSLPAKAKTFIAKALGVSVGEFKELQSNLKDYYGLDLHSFYSNNGQSVEWSYNGGKTKIIPLLASFKRSNGVSAHTLLLGNENNLRLQNGYKQKPSGNNLRLFDTKSNLFVYNELDVHATKEGVSFDGVDVDTRMINFDPSIPVDLAIAAQSLSNVKKPFFTEKIEDRDKNFTFGARRANPIDTGSFIELLKNSNGKLISAANAKSLISDIWKTKGGIAESKDLIEASNEIVEAYKQHFIDKTFPKKNTTLRSEISKLAKNNKLFNEKAFLNHLEFFEKLSTDVNFRNSIVKAKVFKKRAFQRFRRLSTENIPFYEALRKLTKIDLALFTTKKEIDDYNAMLSENPENVNVDRFIKIADALYDTHILMRKQNIKATEEIDEDSEMSPEDIEEEERQSFIDYNKFLQTLVSQRGINDDVLEFLNIDIDDFSMEELKEYNRNLRYAFNNGSFDYAGIDYLNKAKALEIVQEVVNGVDDANVELFNTKAARNIVRDFFSKDSTLEFSNLRHMLNIIDGGKANYGGVLVKKIFDPILERYGKSRIETRRALKSIDNSNFERHEMELMGIYSLLNQNPDVTISRAMLSEGGFLYEAGYKASDLIRSGRVLKLSQINTEVEKEVYELIHGRINDFIESSVIASYGEIPEGFDEKIIEQSMKDILANSRQTDSELKRKKANLLKAYGVSTVAELTKGIRSGLIALSTEQMDYVGKVRGMFSEISNGVYSDGRTMRDMSENYSGETFVEIDNYTPMIRYKSLMEPAEDILDGKAGTANRQDKLFFNVFSDININNQFLTSRRKAVIALKTNLFEMATTRADQQIFYLNHEKERKLLQKILAEDFFKGTSSNGLSADAGMLLKNNLKVYFNRGLTESKRQLRSSEGGRYVQKILNGFRTMLLGSAFKSPAQLSSIVMAMQSLKGNPAKRALDIAWATKEMSLGNRDKIAEFFENHLEEVAFRGVVDYDLATSSFGKNIPELFNDIVNDGYKSTEYGKEIARSMVNADKASQLQLLALIYFDRHAARVSALAAYRNFMTRNNLEVDYDSPNPEGLKFALDAVRETQHSDNPLFKPSALINVGTPSSVPFARDNGIAELINQSVWAFKSFSINEHRTLHKHYNDFLEAKKNGDVQGMTDAMQSPIYNFIGKMFFEMIKSAGRLPVVLAAAMMMGDDDEERKDLVGGHYQDKLNVVNTMISGFMQYFSIIEPIEYFIGNAAMAAEEEIRGHELEDGDYLKYYHSTKELGMFGLLPDIIEGTLKEDAKTITDLKDGNVDSQSASQAAISVLSTMAIATGKSIPGTSEVIDMMKEIRRQSKQLKESRKIKIKTL